MKKPVVNYRAFRLNKITQPEYRHMLLLLGWVWYLIMYAITENLIPEYRLHKIESPVDKLIPFCEGFVILYVYWYLYLVLSLVWYFLYDPRRFSQMQIFIIITQVVAMTVYVVYPSWQDLRPDLAALGRKNVFIWVMNIIYSFDTPTGVCPSLHVAYSCGIASVWMKDEKAPWYFKAFMFLSAVAISLSTMFVKQHSFVDVYWGIALGALAEVIVFGKSWYLPKIKGLFKRKTDE